MINLRSAIIPLLMASTTLILSGCKEKVYAVEYYSSNLAEAAKTIEQCREGEITDQNCDNARAALEQAQKEEHKKKVRDLMKRLD